MGLTLQTPTTTDTGDRPWWDRVLDTINRAIPTFNPPVYAGPSTPPYAEPYPSDVAAPMPSAQSTLPWVLIGAAVLYGLTRK